MGCEEARRLVGPLVDGELGLERALEVEAHLASCAECASMHRDLRALSGIVREGLPRMAAPDGLQQRLRAALPTAVAPAKPSQGPRWRLFAFPALGTAMLATGLALGAFLIGPRLGGQATPTVATAQDHVVDEALSGHLRSLMASHLADVMSSDRHTVKPYFAGKLDFSPPVIDLATQGFPLVAGRLDYLDDRPVAALVYHRNKHVINLFVWPSGDAATSSPTAVSRRGYQIVHWNANGMTEWAVSDLNTAELTEFAEALRQSR